MQKLFTGVVQFAYTCMQEHAVWASQQFWETAFYQDVQQQIRQLYIPQHESLSGITPGSPGTEVHLLCLSSQILLIILC